MRNSRQRGKKGVLRLNVAKYSLELKENEGFEEVGVASDTYEMAELCRRIGLSTKPEEHVYVFMVDNQLNVIGISEVSHGGVSESFVDISNIFKRALLCNAKNIILAHNHPSGGLEPSNQDIGLTERVREGCKSVGIGLLDHLIVSGNRYRSMLEEGDGGFGR